MEKGNSRVKEFQEGERDLPYKNIFLIENLMYNRFKLRLQRKEVPKKIKRHLRLELWEAEKLFIAVLPFSWEIEGKVIQ